MRRPIRSRWLTFVGGACALAVLVFEARSGETADENPADPPIARWIAELDSGDYATRLEATHRLMGVGRPVIEPLIEAARSGSPEVAMRAISVLETIYVAEDLAAAEAAEEGLEALTVSNHRSAAVRAEEVLAAHYDLRRERALTQIERLGGVIVWNDRQIAQPGVVWSPPGERGIAHIALDRNWKGGDEGIKYLKRIENLPMLYLAKGPGFSPISPEAERKLRQALPHLDVQERGLAFLGISGNQDPNGGCLILGVTPGAAADQAGLRGGDIVRRFDGRPVADFQSLIDLIAEKQPGDQVPVTILRAGESLELNVRLGEWSDAISRTSQRSPE